MGILAEFIYLQLLDILTTIAFMMQGVGESNPIIRWVIREGPHPIWALFMLKGGVVLLALFCLYSSRERVLRKVNVFFACLIVYNLVALILSNPAIQ
jgi:hypothetical protein